MSCRKEIIMACRHLEMMSMIHDLKVIEELSSKVKELSECDETIQSSLTGIADVIYDTIVTPDDDLHIKIKQLNNTSSAAIDGMVSNIAIRKVALEKELKDAIVEDLKWHVLHPLG